MSWEEIQQNTKPFVWGLAVGVVGLVIIGFAFNIVVLTSTATEARNDAVQTATVQQLASLCEARARAHRASVNDTTDITGWQQREARRELAGEFAIIMPGKDAADDAVIQACASRLDSA